MTLAEMFRAEMIYRQAAYCLIKHSQIIYKLLQMTLKQDLVVKLYIQHCVAMDHQLKRKLDDFTRFAFNCWVELVHSKKKILLYFFSFVLSFSRCSAASFLNSLFRDFVIEMKHRLLTKVYASLNFQVGQQSIIFVASNFNENRLLLARAS